jgi:hypothetical protein
MTTQTRGNKAKATIVEIQSVNDGEFGDDDWSNVLGTKNRIFNLIQLKAMCKRHT